jgi:hypothetical protein
MVSPLMILIEEDEEMVWSVIAGAVAELSCEGKESWLALIDTSLMVGLGASSISGASWEKATPVPSSSAEQKKKSLITVIK